VTATTNPFVKQAGRRVETPPVVTVLSANGHGRNAPPLADAPGALRPPLPAHVEMRSPDRALAAEGRGWLDKYVAWATQCSPLTPAIMHEAMALWLLATVSTRRMKFTLGGETIYPNLYVLIVAVTTLYRKTTAMKLAKRALTAANLDVLLLPEDATPEALFDELAGARPANFDSLADKDKTDWFIGRAVAAQRAMFLDECSSLFGNLKRDYMAGLAELLLRGYDSDGGKQRKLLKGRGQITVRDLSLSFLGATTPAMFARSISHEESENGFLARFAVITPDAAPLWSETDSAPDVPWQITLPIRLLFEDVLPWHGGTKPRASRDYTSDVVTPPTLSVTAEPQAVRQMQAYRRALNYDLIVSGEVDETRAAAYARLGTMLVKVAMLLAAMDATEQAVRIDDKHVYAAQDICERWRESLHRLDRDLAHVGGLLEDKLMNYLKKAGSAGATPREMKRDLGMKERGQPQYALANLIEEGAVEKYTARESGGKGGRPSYRYRIVE